MNPKRVSRQELETAHGLYCQLTGQKLLLAYDRERAWYEILRAGFTLEDIRRVVRYLQREIRLERRNVGALKLSNLLQPDQFEEDLNISRVRLHAPSAHGRSSPAAAVHHGAPPMSPAELERRREEVARRLAEFRASMVDGTKSQPTAKDEPSTP